MYYILVIHKDSRIEPVVDDKGTLRSFYTQDLTVPTVNTLAELYKDSKVLVVKHVAKYWVDLKVVILSDMPTVAEATHDFPKLGG